MKKFVNNVEEILKRGLESVEQLKGKQVKNKVIRNKDSINEVLTKQLKRENKKKIEVNPRTPASSLDTKPVPTIKKPKRSQRIREGSTIPVFRVASNSNAREITIRSLGIEEAL